MIIIKFIIGGLIVVLLDYISKSNKYYYISGLIPLFPTFALIAHIIVYQNQGLDALKNTAIFGMLSLIPYLIYLLSIYYFSKKINFYSNIILSIFLWGIVAYIIYIIYNKYINI